MNQHGRRDCTFEPECNDCTAEVDSTKTMKYIIMISISPGILTQSTTTDEPMPLEVCEQHNINSIASSDSAEGLYSDTKAGTVCA